MSPNADPERVQALLHGLNEPQREAVTHGEGPLLILAGAGSGKTRVLTHRIAYLIFTGRARPSEILAITFTNKAAQEMRERVERLLGDEAGIADGGGHQHVADGGGDGRVADDGGRPASKGITRGMWLMTFHAACARILRAKGELLGYTRRFTIYDQLDSRRLIKRCMDDLGIDPKRFAPAAIQSQISTAKNGLLDSSEYAQRSGSHFEEMVGEVYRLYEKELLQMNAMDFDDLLYRAVNLFELYGEVRERYATAFKHVLVDEYQDTNHAQYRLLQLLVGGGRDRLPGGDPQRSPRAQIVGHRNLAVVGDDSQSIYSFRCADIRNILDFQDDFPDARVVKLEQNYRSTQTILDAANAVIANNRGGIAKHLWSELGRGGLVHVRGVEDEHAEARLVVGEIERLLDEDPTRPSRADIAVLYRTNAASRVIEDALVRSETPYQVIGGTKFYERAEIKDAIAYLAWLANPFDVVSFQRVANSPRRGLGQTSLSRIVAHSATVGESVWEVAAAAEAIPGLGAAAVKSLGRFMATMEDLAGLAQEGVPVGDLMEAMLARTGYVEALEAETVGRGEKALEAQGRLENLQQLVEVAHEFDAGARQERDTLDLFLQELALKSDADSRRDDEGLVTLMTLHNAKGLEYPIVFIAGCEEGVFPHARAIDEGGLEEERRLFYVGVTRAMRELYLTYARRRSVFGEPTFALTSRFIEEIPPELLEIEDTSPARALGTSWSAPPNGAGRPRERAASGGAQFRLGEDIVHAAFGEGVVTGVEPGGVIVVRFATDGSERKLMADYAPLSRR